MLILSDLEIFYHKTQILTNINLGFQQGRLVSLLGTNGSGKSSVLKAIFGFLKIRGEINFNGVCINQLSFKQKSNIIGYMPQSLPNGQITVLEAVMFARGNHKDALFDSVKILNMFEIEHLSMQILSDLSGGQKQLVALACVIIRKPKIMLLDEPLSALDLYYQQKVMQVVKDLTVEHNLITIMVVHDLNIVMRYADDCVVLHGGAVHSADDTCTVITQDMVKQVYKVNSSIGVLDEKNYIVFT